MRVLLVQPSESQNAVGFNKFGCPEPLALAILAATLPQHQVEILDIRIDSDLEGRIRALAPSLVGVTGHTPSVPQMLSVCKHAKELDAEITSAVGGYHATLCPEDFNVEYVDVIVVGEGENTLPELVTALEEDRDLGGVAGLIYRKQGQQISTQPRQLLPDLDESPFPARHLTDPYRKEYFFQFWTSPTPVETARGCPHNCKFCSAWVFHRSRCRFKLPERVLEELRRVRSNIAYFVDDNFLQNLRRAEKVCQLIKEAALRLRYWMQARSDSIVRRPDLVERFGSDWALDTTRRVRKAPRRAAGRTPQTELHSGRRGGGAHPTSQWRGYLGSLHRGPSLGKIRPRCLDRIRASPEDQLPPVQRPHPSAGHGILPGEAGRIDHA